MMAIEGAAAQRRRRISSTCKSLYCVRTHAWCQCTHAVEEVVIMNNKCVFIDILYEVSL